MGVYVLRLESDGETYINVIKDNTHLRRKLIKIFNEEYNYCYDDTTEERDRMIEELIEHHYTTGDMLNDFGHYYLEKTTLL